MHAYFRLNFSLDSKFPLLKPSLSPKRHCPVNTASGSLFCGDHSDTEWPVHRGRKKSLLYGPHKKLKGWLLLLSNPMFILPAFFISVMWKIAFRGGVFLITGSPAWFQVGSRVFSRIILFSISAEQEIQNSVEMNRYVSPWEESGSLAGAWLPVVHVEGTKEF